MSCQFCGAPEIVHEKTSSSMTFQCETVIYMGLDARLRQSKRCLQVERQRIACALDRVNAANIRALGMICDAARIPHDADILEWISGARERIARMEEAGDDLRVCCESVVPASDVAKCVKRWTAAKEAQP